ncbi:MAG: response regulator [Rhodocyclaceae bacterium]|nr:response regulator [Rhodocyclaceae bacterium]
MPPTIAAKIIIVDDAAAVRGMLRALLADEGYSVVADLASGGGLLAAVERHAPDIVCLDYNLPDADGLELLKQVHDAHPMTAVVMITGSADPELEGAAAEAGAAGFIRKPFSPDKILKELHQVAYTRRLLAATQQQAQAAAIALKTPRARAVIADDSATMRLLLKAILERAAVAVVGEACDGKQAVDLALRHRPDLVCLDLDMPVMNGFEALQSIHADDPAVKILMITGNANRDAILQAGKSGARGYILKPFHPEKVVEAIGRLLG